MYLNNNQTLQSWIDGLKSDMINTIYPVNSLYFNDSETSPASLFGGDWERIEKKFILGHGSGNVLKGTGGEESHLLTQSEIPSLFPIPFGSNTIQGSDYARILGLAIGLTQYQDTWHVLINDGGSNAHNNMPPYYVSCIWRRNA